MTTPTPLVDTLLFDLGNVLAFFDHMRTCRVLAASSPLGPRAIYAKLFGSGLERDFDLGRLTPDAFVAQVRRECRLSCDPAAVVRAWQEIFWANRPVCRLVPRLGPFRRLLGSNTNRLHADYFRRAFRAALEPLDSLVLSYEIGHRKPDPPFYEACLARGRCRPDRCVLIDDRLDNLEGARRLGIRTIHYRDFGGLVEELAALGVRPQPADRPAG